LPADAPNQVTRLLAAIGDGKRVATDDLLPLVYEELRRIARHQMGREPAGHTLQATALVHEAYLHLLGDENPSWDTRGHFFAAAAEAMRRILVDRARRKQTPKHGGDQKRVPLEDVEIALEDEPSDMIALDDALTRLKERDSRLYDVAMLRHFAGLSNDETALALDVSTRTVRREWSYARVWLLQEIESGHRGND
jgi:RNA polymerase sigma factor (TIGR02999 family)